MIRREFLKALGLVAATAAVTPRELLSLVSELEVCTDYPELSFTGFKLSQTQPVMAGQFLWIADYETIEGETDRTYWHVNIPVDLSITHDMSNEAKVQYVRFMLQNGARSAMQYMDEVLADALAGVVQTSKYTRIPNPEFNPELPETDYYDDESEIQNPRMIQGPAPKVKIRKLKLSKYPDCYQEWNIDKLTALTCAQFKLLS